MGARAAWLAASLLVGATIGPALAQDLPAATDRLLWCASAFYWLAGNAYDSGANAEARRYEDWSGALMDQAIPALRSAGRTDDEIQTLVEGYDDRVLDQLGAPDAPYDAAACPALVGGKPPTSQ